MTESHEHDGMLFDDFLREEGIYDEVVGLAAAQVLAWQLQEQMREQGITKVEMAHRMGTSRSQLDRLLKPDGSGVTLDTISRAAKAVNRKLRLELV